jgi:hypothetical protein
LARINFNFAMVFSVRWISLTYEDGGMSVRSYINDWTRLVSGRMPSTSSCSLGIILNIMWKYVINVECAALPCFLLVRAFKRFYGGLAGRALSRFWCACVVCVAETAYLNNLIIRLTIQLTHISAIPLRKGRLLPEHTPHGKHALHCTFSKVSASVRRRVKCGSCNWNQTRADSVAR